MNGKRGCCPIRILNRRQFYCSPDAQISSIKCLKLSGCRIRLACLHFRPSQRRTRQANMVLISGQSLANPILAGDHTCERSGYPFWPNLEYPSGFERAVFRGGRRWKARDEMPIISEDGSILPATIRPWCLPRYI